LVGRFILRKAQQFPDFWDRNYRSFLNYFEQALFGISGTISDANNGDPITAAIYIEGHDMDNSWVSSRPENGNYFRPIFAGEYNITFSADEYQTKTINQVSITNRELTTLDVELVYTGSGVYDISASSDFQIGPNPNSGKVYLTYHGKQNHDCEIQVLNIMGEMVMQVQQHFSTGSTSLILDIEQQSTGIYFVTITSEKFNLSEKVIKQ